MTISLNTVLAKIDRRADRFASSLSRRVYTLSLHNGVDGTHSLDAALAAQLLDYMWAAHELGVAAARSARFSNKKKPNKDQREAMREFYDSIARSASNKTMSQVRSKVQMSMKDLIDDKKNYRSHLKGLVAKSAPKHLIATIERTTTSLAFNAATWAESYNDEDLWGYEITTADDERVRATHVPFNGVRYPKDDEFWSKYAPPNGWNCRCGMTPIYGRSRQKMFKGVPEVDKAFRWNVGAMFVKKGSA